MAADHQQKQTFIFEAGKVLPPLCHKFVTRVVAARNDGACDHRGTALMIRFGDQQAFVTALHVLTEIERDANYRSFGFSAVAEGGYVDIHRFEDVDVAVIFQREPVSPKDGNEFWSSERTDASSKELASDYLLVHGYPDIFTHFTTFLPGFVSESYTHFAAIRPRESTFSPKALSVVREQFPNYLPVPDSVMKPSQFAINYAEDSGPLRTAQGEEITSEATLKSYSRLYSDGIAFAGQERHGAFGLSGSPVWRYGAIECTWSIDNWSKNLPSVTGIVTGWNEGCGIHIATPFSEITHRLFG